MGGRSFNIISGALGGTLMYTVPPGTCCCPEWNVTLGTYSGLEAGREIPDQGQAEE